MRRWLDRLPWWGAIAFFALALFTLGRDPRIARSAFQAFSAFNEQDTGLSLAYAYLSKTGSAAVVSRPVERSFLESDAVLFRIGPDSAVPPGLRKPKKGG